MKTVVTRFPPSPTGFLHIGGARTALFNWLHARHMKGKFILRIEDTDLQRSSRESVDAIFEALEWLQIDWDEGPYFQSERFAIYREYIDRLIDSGHAYYCTCSQQQIESMRERARASGQKPRYDGSCRDKGLHRAENAVVRFKAPAFGTTVVDDVIKGPIIFQNSELDDFIIARSDGTPTYNFVVVVDDITMGINTVIRGDDHVMNTPKQILIYHALGSPLPIFGHVPMVLGSDRTRLSKRHGAMSVTAYRDMGYLPDALINYLVRLGWSHGDQEFFTREELVEKFTLQNVGKSAGVFNPEKLLALNAEHIRSMEPGRIAAHLMPFLTEKGIHPDTGPFIENVIRTLRFRSKTLVEMASAAAFYFTDTVVYDEKGAEKFLCPAALAPLQQLLEGLENLAETDDKSLQNLFQQVMERAGLKLGQIAQPVRVALTGGTVSPGVFEMIQVLGKDKVLERIRKAIHYIEKKEGQK